MSRKSVWPIIAGFLLFVVLNAGTDLILRGFFPKAFSLSAAPQGALGALGSLITIFYASSFCVLSGYLTAVLAPSRPVMHALVLGSIVFLFSLGGLVGSWDRAPAWFNVGFLVVVSASAWLGGILRARQLQP